LRDRTPAAKEAKLTKQQLKVLFFERKTAHYLTPRKGEVRPGVRHGRIGVVLGRENRQGKELPWRNI
jgi:hypothetical protein